MAKRFQDFNGKGLPCVPTTALPGSSRKVEVLIGRVERREQMWHDGDARFPRVGLTHDIGHGTPHDDADVSYKRFLRDVERRMKRENLRQVSQ